MENQTSDHCFQLFIIILLFYLRFLSPNRQTFFSSSEPYFYFIYNNLFIFYIKSQFPFPPLPLIPLLSPTLFPMHSSEKVRFICIFLSFLPLPYSYNTSCLFQLLRIRHREFCYLWRKGPSSRQCPSQLHGAHDPISWRLLKKKRMRFGKILILRTTPFIYSIIFDKVQTLPNIQDNLAPFHWEELSGGDTHRLVQDKTTHLNWAPVSSFPELFFPPLIYYWMCLVFFVLGTEPPGLFNDLYPNFLCWPFLKLSFSDISPIFTTCRSSLSFKLRQFLISNHSHVNRMS